MRKKIMTAFLYFILITFFIIGILSAISGIINFIDYYSFESHPFSIKELSKLGEYITPAGILFTISLISATILTVLKQQESNKLQREEFEYNKIDAKKELFVNHFFQLLKIYQNIITDLEIRILESRGILENLSDFQKVPYYKRDALYLIYEDIINRLNRITVKEIETTNNIEMTFKETYQEFYTNNQEYIGHYFRTIYQIVKLIDIRKNILSTDEIIFYSDILSAQLSSTELVLLFYYCLSEQGNKLQKYVIKYKLLKHLDKSLLSDMGKEELLQLFGNKIIINH